MATGRVFSNRKVTEIMVKTEPESGTGCINRRSAEGRVTSGEKVLAPDFLALVSFGACIFWRLYFFGAWVSGLTSTRGNFDTLKMVDDVNLVLCKFDSIRESSSSRSV